MARYPSKLHGLHDELTGVLRKAADLADEISDAATSVRFDRADLSEEQEELLELLSEAADELSQLVDPDNSSTELETAIDQAHAEVELPRWTPRGFRSRS